MINLEEVFLFLRTRFCLMITVSRMVFNIDKISDSNLLKGKDWILEYGGQLVIRRMEGENFSLKGNDVFVDGIFDFEITMKLVEIFGNPLSVRFNNINTENVIKNIKRASCFRASGNGEIFFGVFRFPLILLKKALGVNSGKEIYAMSLSSVKFIESARELLVCKPKGIVYSRRDFIEIVLPNLRIDELWSLIEEWSKKYIPIDSELSEKIISEISIFGKLRELNVEKILNNINIDSIDPLRACHSGVVYSRVYE